MKRTVIALIISSIVFMPGCYDNNNAVVRIKITNIPASSYAPKKHFIDRLLDIFSSEAYAQVPTDIIRLYVAAFEGDSPLAVVSVNYMSSTQTVELEVPAGAARNIVVLAENNTGIISYYGKTVSPVDLAAGEETSVAITMKMMSAALSLRFNSSLSREEWDKITGASGYNLYESGPTFLDSTTNTYYPVIQMKQYYLEVDFSFAGKKSDRFGFYPCG